MSQPLTIALVAGEASGDQLGGKLIEALRAHYPEARYCGIGGRHMRDAGFEAWWDRDELSVMGLFEVARHLPRLLRLRRALEDRLLETKPDVLIGIDDWSRDWVEHEATLAFEPTSRHAGTL